MRFLLAILLLSFALPGSAVVFIRDPATADSVGAGYTVLNTASATFTRTTGAYDPTTDAIALINARRTRTQVIGTTNYTADLIEGSRTNLLAGTGEAFQQWTAANGLTVTQNTTAAPNGETIAQTLTDPGASLSSAQQTFTVANDSLVHVVSIYVLKTTGATAPTFGVTMALSGGTPVTTTARIDTDDGSQEYGSNANTTVETSSAGTWYRVKVAVTNNTSGNTTLTLDVYPAASAHNASVDAAATTGTAICTFAALEKASFASSYAGDRNLLLRSEQFNNTWNVTRSTITADSTANPLDATVTADTLVEDGTAANTHFVGQSIAKAAASIEYTYSVYIKQSGRTWAYVQCSDSAITNGAGIYFDVANGVKGTAVALGTGFTLNASHIVASGAWYRCDIDVTSNTAVTIRSEVYSSTGDLLAIHNGNSAAALILYGGQLVYGSVSKNYWPTLSITGQRVLDLLLSGTTLSTSEGTCVALIRPYGWTGDQDGSSNYNVYQSASNTVKIVRSGATTFDVSRAPTSGTAGATALTWSPANLVTSSCGFTYSSTAVQAYVSGTATGTTDTSIATPYLACTSEAVGSAASSVLQLYGWALDFYRDGALPPSTMQIFANGITP